MTSQRPKNPSNKPQSRLRPRRFRAASVLLAMSMLFAVVGLTPQPAAAAGTDFVDVPKGSYYDAPSQWAVHDSVAQPMTARIGHGGGYYFDPERTVTRLEVVVTLWKYAFTKAPLGTTPRFADHPTDPFEAEALSWARDFGNLPPYLPGTIPLFRPISGKLSGERARATLRSSISARRRTTTTQPAGCTAKGSPTEPHPTRSRPTSG